MRAFRNFSYLALAVSLVRFQVAVCCNFFNLFQFFSTVYLSASVAALFWFSCTIVENPSPPFDILKFIYFRSPQCNAKFELTLHNINHGLGIQFKDESLATKKTFALAVMYLVVNLTLITTAIMAICNENTS